MFIEAKEIQSVYEIVLPRFEDARGVFVKSFHEPSLLEAKLTFELKESYFSFSKKNVIRGMHFQLPPHDHEKIVFCPQGKIMDVILDIRKNSPTYGKHLTIELSAENHKAVFIPKGCAHGFLSLEDNALTYYLVSSAHHPASDTGILYNSFDCDWQVENPILSERDLDFSRLEDFDSPF